MKFWVRHLGQLTMTAPPLLLTRACDATGVQGGRARTAAEPTILGRRDELVHRNLLPAPAQLGQLPAVSAELLPGRRRRRAAETAGARRRVAGGGAAGLGPRSRRSSRSVRHVPGPARQQVLRRFRLPRGVLRHRVAGRRHQSMRSAALRRRRDRLPPMRCRRLLLTTNALKKYLVR